jgi:hypothetical protein
MELQRGAVQMSRNAYTMTESKSHFQNVCVAFTRQWASKDTRAQRLIRWIMQAHLKAAATQHDLRGPPKNAKQQSSAPYSPSCH